MSVRRRSKIARAVLSGAIALSLATIGSVSVSQPTAAAAGDPCGTGGNKIACENSKPGTPASVWDVDGSGDTGIQGFATDISVNVGQKIDFKIKTTASAYTIDIYRTGYYGGDGARKIASVTPSATLPQSQPQCITDTTTTLYDCGNWGVSASWNVPSTAVSGVYFARLNRTSNNDSSHITFIVRDDASTSDVVFQTSDPTWQAYNTYGGSNFYSGGPNGRAYKLSYNRPMSTRDGPGGRDFFFSNEYPLVRFLERNGYDVSYIAGVDSDRHGNLLTHHKTFLSVGHDEYWSGPQRANVEAARDAGVNLMFLSGNEVYWKTRYESSADASQTPYRTLVSYKETWANAKIDPSPEWTGTWRDPRFAPTSKGAGRPENALTGTAYMVNDVDLPLTVQAAEGKYRLWRNTSIANLATGTKATLAPHTLGYESDEDLDNGSRPPGLVRLSTTTGPVPQYLQDFGTNVAPGTTRHNLTLYRAASGALVFGAGTVQWTWGLDSVHDSPYAAQPADLRMQQVQVNLLADMRAQPTTLQSGLVAASASSDTTGPTVSITSPAASSAIPNGNSVTLTGTAADTGGLVAGVEVSTDGGGSWHPATGTTTWTYTYVQHGTGSVPVRVRGIDDSANQGAIASRSFNVSCECTVFGVAAPSVPSVSDPGAVELGLRFSPTGDGFVSGVRFYKGSGNTGTHEGSLWSTTGERLAAVTFTNETSTGWQTAAFASPVPVTAGTSYVVSYTAPNGHYPGVLDAFTAQGVDATPLQVAGGFGVPAAGVYGPSGRFPNASYRNTAYGVDATFTTVDESPLIATNQWPIAGSSSVPASGTVSATFNKPVVNGTQQLTLKDANNATVAGATTYDAATRTITFTPGSPLSGFVKYTATLAGTDAQGNDISTGKTWSFTTAKPDNAPGVCPCSIFGDSTTPTLLEDVDKVPVTLGTRFSSDVSGTVTGVRFYKGPNNVGSHTGTLWAADGTQLATGTFTNESTTGWQDLRFSTPVDITAGTEYIASYRTTVGRYSATPNAFAAGDLSRAPLRVTSTSGSYTYGTGFPSNSSGTSYLVDVVFEKAPPTIAVTARRPADSAVDVARDASTQVWFSKPVTSGSNLSVEVGNQAVAGSTTLRSDGTKLTFTPSAPMPPDTTVSVTLSGVTSLEGASLPTQSWSFRTGSSSTPTTESLFGNQLPTTPSTNEGSPVELGTVFTPSKSGKVTGVRFYKGTGNDGAHTGSLWSMSGQRLATVTFTDETPDGWQTAQFTSPVVVTAGTSYVVSYLAPQGHYSATSGFFSSTLTNGSLSAPSGANGRYLYGVSGGFPTGSWGSTNYFVDVLFQRDAPTIQVTQRTPADGATDVVSTANPSISFSEPLASGWSMSVKQGSTDLPGTAALSGDGTHLTFSPASPLPTGATITITVAGVQSTDGASLPAQTWTFTTEAAATTLTSLLTGLIPATASVNDPDSVELGMAFSTSTPGSVTAITFYKGAGNTGTHTGSLWNASGQRLATVTFTNETASGWQRAALAAPVALTPGETYVVSYLAPNGGYSVTPAYFNSARAAGPLTAITGNNGRYLYGPTGGFPTGSYNATNYFIDVEFRH